MTSYKANSSCARETKDAYGSCLLEFCCTGIKKIILLTQCFLLTCLWPVLSSIATRLPSCLCVIWEVMVYCRLRVMLAAEEDDQMVEMRGKEETVLERQARMREMAKQLKDRRESERY